MDGFVHDLSPISEVGGFSLDTEIPVQKNGVLDKVHKALGQELQNVVTRVQAKPAAPFVHPGTLLLDRGDFLATFTDSQAEDLRNRVATFDVGAKLNDYTNWLVRRGVPECYLANALYPIMNPPTGSYNSAILTRSNLRFKGAGYGAELMLAPNYSVTYANGQDYTVIGPATHLEFTQNFFMEDLHVNGNALNGNLPTGGKNYNISGLRSYIAFSMYRGDRVALRRCFWRNFAGRQIIRAGWLDNPPQIDRLKIEHNEFYNVGPGCGAYFDSNNNAIYLTPWNDDFSGVYAHGQRQWILFNAFYNPISINPFYPIDLNDGQGVRIFPLTCNAFELHGQRTLMMGNRAVNFTSLLNLVAQVHPHYNPEIVDNEGYNLSKYGIAFSADPFIISGAKVMRNTLHMDASWDSGPVAPIYQGMRGSTTCTPLTDIQITHNTLFSDISTAKSQSWSGIDLYSVDGGAIDDNIIFNVQAYGIYVNHNSCDPTHPLPLRNVTMNRNRIRDCGKQVGGQNVHGIRVNFTDLNRIIENLEIDVNFIGRTVDVNYNASPNMKGIQIDNGNAYDVRIGNRNRFANIKRQDRVTFANVTAHKNVYVLPRMYSSLANSVPKAGFGEVGLDYWFNTDLVRGGAAMRGCTTAGGFYKGQWAPGITVAAGDWYRLASGQKVKYLRGGITGDVEPVLDPTQIWNSFADDGTAHCVITDIADAVLTPGAKFTIPFSGPITGFTLNPGEATAVVTQAVATAGLGMFVKAAISRDLNGVQIHAWVSATATVKYYFSLPSTAPAPVTILDCTLTMEINS